MLVELYDTAADLKCIGQVSWEIIPRRDATLAYEVRTWKVIGEKFFGGEHTVITHLYLEEIE